MCAGHFPYFSPQKVFFRISDLGIPWVLGEDLVEETTTIYIYMIIYVYNYIYIVQYMYHLFEVYAKHFSIKNNGLWHWANSIGTWPAYFQGMKSAMWS